MSFDKKLEAIGISIHSPRVGGDGYNPCNGSGLDNFNPLPPCGGRREGAVDPITREEFQSTPPRVGGDAHRHREALPPGISIHSPRVGGDQSKIFYHNGK